MTVSRTSHRTALVNVYRCVCDICGRVLEIKTRGKLRYCREILRMKGWRGVYLGESHGSHDHCDCCLETHQSRKPPLRAHA